MEIGLRAAQAYARVYAAIKQKTNLNLKGLGWMLRRIRRDAVVNVDGVRLFIDHRIATSYGLLVSGRVNEVETASLLRRVLSPQTTVVDVGANIGEIVVQAAPRCRSVIAFEPHPVAAHALRRTIELNGFAHVEVIEALVGDGTALELAANARNANASAARAGGDTASARLDDHLRGTTGELVIVIDVEGGEPHVLRGALATIERLRPLIVFEYNDVSRRAFRIDDVRDLLGNRYRIFRLRRDGQLDQDYERAWNCVAIPVNSRFEEILVRHA
jgi:FkbM family methyltransferase